MHLTLRRGAVGAATISLAITGLAVAIAQAAPASAAPASCQAGVTQASASTSHSNAPVIKTGRIQLKHKRHQWKAARPLTATYWSATVTVHQTICSGDTANTTLTYPASAGATASPVSATAKGRGSTKRAAKKAVKARLSKARKALARKAKSPDHAGQAVSTARAKATSAVLGEAHVVYFTLGSGQTVTTSTVAPAGAMVLGHDAAGDLSLTVPSGPGAQTKIPCLIRPSSWPAAYVFDGGVTGITAPGTGSTTFSDPGAFQSDDATNWSFVAGGIGLVDGVAETDHQTLLWSHLWSTAGTGQPTTEAGRFAVTGPSANIATQSYLCFVAYGDSGTFPTGTVTLHAPRIGSSWIVNGTTATLANPRRLVIG
jgi:hypothetical protein